MPIEATGILGAQIALLNRRAKLFQHAGKLRCIQAGAIARLSNMEGDLLSGMIPWSANVDIQVFHLECSARPLEFSNGIGPSA